jgi:hypothetical protein
MNLLLHQVVVRGNTLLQVTEPSREMPGPGEAPNTAFIQSLEQPQPDQGNSVDNPMSLARMFQPRPSPTQRDPKLA